ncbi:MAG: hypothetical protein R3190_07110, partial [Thermoanaerobaculia bacterium]|nr:hypothetical protein [Thermoanaerobaculia bacterium]
MLRPYRELVAVKAPPPPLPADLRRRLLEVPSRRPRRTRWRAITASMRRPPLWLRSPALAAIASYVLMLGLTLATGSPYQLGRRTVNELRSST